MDVLCNVSEELWVYPVMSVRTCVHSVILVRTVGVICNVSKDLWVYPVMSVRTRGFNTINCSKESRRFRLGHLSLFSTHQVRNYIICLHTNWKYSQPIGINNRPRPLKRNFAQMSVSRDSTGRQHEHKLTI